MEGTHIEYAAAVIEKSVFLCDPEIFRNIFLRGYPAHADDYLRAHQSYLAVEPCGARLLLLGQRVAVLRRAALDGVCDIDIPVPEQVYGRHELIEQLTASPDERLALEILLLTGSLADKHDLRVLFADAENDIRARPAKTALAAVQALLPELLPGRH